MKRYVVGFMFDDALKNVCMIRKNRPEWQKGFLNGIGGKIDERETSLEAMLREFKEETGVATKARDWAWVCTLRFTYAEVDFYAGRDSVACSAVKTTTDEEVCLISCYGEMQVVENIPPLLTLSLQRIRDREGVAPLSGPG